MKQLVILFALAACGGEKSSTPSPVRNTATSAATDPLPTDEAMGELALVPVRSRDVETWLPVGTNPVLVEGALREGKGPPPSWLATDTAGTQTKLTYGTTAKLPYGCDGNAMTVTMLDGDGGKLRSGVLWLRPLDQAAWDPKALAIRGDEATAARRVIAVGALQLRMVRTEPKRGVVDIVRDGRLVHQMAFERSDMEGADNTTPIDVAQGGPGVPSPEAAWSFGSDLIAIVFRVPGYEGMKLETIVVNARTGRTVESMATYLYHCAF